MVSTCPQCGAPVGGTDPECRGCGASLESNARIQAVIEDDPWGTGTRLTTTVVAPDTAPRCEICEDAPRMIPQEERADLKVPGILAGGGVLFLVVGLFLGGGILGGVAILLAAGCLGGAVYVATRVHRYWLCPRCGDITEASAQSS